jgi:hypothetical protein
VNIQEKVQAALVADSGITALVAAYLIKPRDTGQQKLGKTYIIHEPAGGSIPTITHGATEALRHWPAYQVHCCGPTLGAALGIADAVRSCLGDYGRSDSAKFRSMFDGDGTPEIDEERGVVMVSLDFDIWENVNE